jgi:hypothetical protein
MAKLIVAFGNFAKAPVDFGVPVAAHAGALTTDFPGTKTTETIRIHLHKSSEAEYKKKISF